MSPDRIKAIRTGAGLTQAGLAAVLRLQGPTGKRTVRRWETGEQQVTGPASLILELLEAGKLPKRYFAGVRIIRPAKAGRWPAALVIPADYPELPTE